MLCSAGGTPSALCGPHDEPSRGLQRHGLECITTSQREALSTGRRRVEEYDAVAIAAYPSRADSSLGSERSTELLRPGAVPRVPVVGRRVHERTAASVPVEQERHLAVDHRARVARSPFRNTDEVPAVRLRDPDEPLPTVPVLCPRFAFGAQPVTPVWCLGVVLVHEAAHEGSQLPPPRSRGCAGVVSGVAWHIARGTWEHVIAAGAERAPDGADEGELRRGPGPLSGVS